jgi:hypothetical protein
MARVTGFDASARVATLKKSGFIKKSLTDDFLSGYLSVPEISGGEEQRRAGSGDVRAVSRRVQSLRDG